MAITFVQSKSIATSGATSITTPSATSVAGNCVVASVSQFNGTTPTTGAVTDNKSNTYTRIYATNVSTAWGAAYYCLNILGGAGHTWTYTPPSSLACALAIAEFSGVASASALDQSASAGTSGSPAHSSGAMSATAQADTLLVGFGSATTGSVAPVGDPFFTDVVTLPNSSPEGIILSFAIVNATGAYNFKYTNSNTLAEGVGIATFKGTGIAYVQARSIATSGASSITTPSFTSTAGNCLVAGCSAGANIPATPVTDNKSSTWTNAWTDNTASSAKAACFFALNIPGGAGQTVTYTPTASTFCALAVAEFSGVDASSALDKTANAHAAADPHDSGNTATTSQAHELLIGIGGSSHGSNIPYSTVLSALWTDAVALADSSPSGVLLSWRVVAAIDAYSFTYNLASGFTNGVAGIAAFKGVNADVTVPLTGASSTGSTGSVSASGFDVSRALTGASSTGSAGSLASSRTRALAGSSSTGAAGDAAPIVPGAITQHGATVVLVKQPALRVTAHGATIIRISDPCAAGITYENPCAIRNPVFWVAIVDENGNVLKAGVKPLRDIQSYYGGYGAPRLLSLDNVQRVATDWLTRGWQAQSASVTLADSDHAVRGLTRGDLGGCQFYAYLTDDASRASHRFQRLLFQGPVLTDDLPGDAVTRVVANDVIGVDYSLFSEDKLVPQRTIDGDFPNRPPENAGFGVPVILGDVKDPDAFGAVKTFDLGDVTLNSLTKRALMVCGHAVHELTVYQNNEEISVSDENAWWPGSDNWVDLMPDEEAYAEVNGNWYTLVLVDGWRDAAIDAGARLDKGSWTASAAYAVGDAVAPASNMIDGQGKFLYCSVAGTAGSSDTLTVPAVGATLTDGSVTWIAVSETAAPIYFDAGGFGTKANATGAKITSGPLQVRLVLINFLIQSWAHGNWLPSPRFETFPGNGNFVCRVDTLSFDVADEVGTWYLDGGLKGGGIIGAGGKREQVRKVWADLLTSFNLMATQSQYQQIKVAMLDRRRANFVTGVATIDDRRDILAAPGFSITKKREWLCNDLGLSWEPNYRDDGRGDWNGFTVKGNAPSKVRYGVVTKTMTLPYARDDDTANVVGQQALDFRSQLRLVASWSQSLCGLRRDVLDSVPITAKWGRGEQGWRDQACWILSQSIDSQNEGCSVAMTAVDVQDLVSQDERLRVSCPGPVTLASEDGDPVVATFDDPEVTGGRAPVTGSYDHPSGGSFPVGATVVTWTAVSADGQTASCFLVVTVSSTSGTFSLFVGDGSGDGPHSPGDEVPVVADPPPPGKRFAGWSGPDVANIDDALSVAATFTMPSANAEIDATYVDLAVPSGQLLLEWDANPEEEEVLGYVLEWGTSPGVYTNSRDVGSTLTYLLTGLTPGATYYVAIEAYNAGGYSPDSMEITDVADLSP